jgi:zona occludens toxin
MRRGVFGLQLVQKFQWHFTEPSTGVTCDLVLMIQDFSTLNRFIKNVVAFNARTHKKISLGFSRTYSITLYEGSKQTKATAISVSVRNYRNEIFPLYSSFKGGAEGKSVNVDKRQNIFNSKKLLFMIVVYIVLALFAGFFAFRFFSPRTTNQKDGGKDSAMASSKNAVANSTQNNQPAKPEFSEIWRVAGAIVMAGNRYILIADANGRLRYVSPSMFHEIGPEIIGEVDGAKVTRYSGVPPTGASSPRSGNVSALVNPERK